jgi:hypothetical protein
VRRPLRVRASALEIGDDAHVYIGYYCGWKKDWS